MRNNPIICAIDTTDVAKAAALAADLKGTVGALKLGLEFFTANGAAGVAKVAQAEAAKSLPHKPLVVGVTVLTSLDQNDLRSIGVNDVVSHQAKRLAALAQRSGLDGVVCSPHEIAVLREQCGKDFTLVVPGIRPEGSAQGDQKRTMTPKEALAAGADYLVIGRPITTAPSPKLAAEAIVSSL